MELDKIDKLILNILQVDSKITNAALAQQINLSPAATLERVKKLEQHEIITNYVAQVDYAKLGFLVHLMVGVRLQKTTAEHIKLFKLTVDKIAMVTACYQVIGAFDFILIVHTKHLPSYQAMVVEKLHMLPFVEYLQTLSVVRLIKNKLLSIE
ncbi:MAG: Lrp/AsnC family transcriptional regulator [Candidatus Cardinium sp.]|uniref:Lrp/AsnC family transcriptional regulator n=1 Tax=Cardinium endosymbiont of Dermatophagoides farinae TaxID=2597823 RepID=UPI00118447CB|nr:Lrp/AsnC family transcriptional regulator [Cardinium endosymbiont of Dermatophagoides farinae]TSJ80645.1 Lrp/AsnC family transcriptional regulator [Cardinium endosymbiont of Dermatophagoides farinae]UWW96640.1 MAG: Lrp/AsnC family transcriptional regulator [Candidatus Cardinium sp.]